jgi:hypothetical protein
VLGSILESPDGLTWIPHDSVTTKTLTSVRYIADTFVAVGVVGTILTSPNGSDWENRGGTSTESFRDIAYRDGNFVIASDSPDPAATLISSNLVQWVKPALPTISGGRLTSISAGFSGFVTVGGDYYPVIANSVDGLTWTNRIQLVVAAEYSPGIFGAPGLTRCTSDGNVSAILDDHRQVHTSGDGIYWTAHRTGATTEHDRAIAFGDGAWVAVGGTIVVSTNLDDWTQKDVLPIVDHTIAALKDVAYANRTFVAVGNQGVILTSTNAGSSWIWQTNGIPDLTLRSVTLRSIVWGKGQFVVTSDSDFFLTSADATTWVQRTNIVPNTYASVTFGRGTFVAVGYGAIATSADGIDWSPQSIGTKANLYGVCYGAGMFVAVGDPDPFSPTHTSIFTSPDGTNWVSRIGVVPPLLDVVYANGSFLAVGWYGTMLRSAPFPPIELQFLGLVRQSDGTATLTIDSRTMREFALDSSENLTSWNLVRVITNVPGVLSVDDTAAKGLPRRFYRARTINP